MDDKKQKPDPKDDIAKKFTPEGGPDVFADVPKTEPRKPYKVTTK